MLKLPQRIAAIPPVLLEIAQLASQLVRKDPELAKSARPVLDAGCSVALLESLIYEFVEMGE